MAIDRGRDTERGRGKEEAEGRGGRREEGGGEMGVNQLGFSFAIPAPDSASPAPPLSLPPRRAARGAVETGEASKLTAAQCSMVYVALHRTSKRVR